jgi:hypothetical protein
LPNPFSGGGNNNSPPTNPEKHWRGTGRGRDW